MAKKEFISVILLIGCLLLSGCGGEIEGKVVDIQNNPIQGVEVSISDTKFTATTNVNGEYKIKYAPGSFHLNFKRLPCYEMMSVGLSVGKKMKYPLGDVVLASRAGELLNTIIKKDFEAAKALVKCFPEEIEPHLDYALYLVASNSNDTDLALLLINNGADVNSSYNPLIAASGSGNGRPRIDLADLLISKGADVNAADRQGGTAIFSAATYGAHGLVELLLKHGANPNAVDKYNGTALIRASRNGDYEMTKLLVDNGADVNLKDNKGLSPLLATKRKEIKIFLTSKGAN